MNDISPEILAKIEEEFSKRFFSDEKVKRIYKKISEGIADYKDVHELAQLLGMNLTDVLETIYDGYYKAGKLPNDTLYQNIVEKTLSPMIKEGDEIVAEAASCVQNDLNRRNGTGIKAVRPQVRKDRIDGLVQEVTNVRNTKLTKTTALDQIVNYTLSYVDHFIETNLGFLTDSGLKPKISRMRGPGMNPECDYCQRLVYTGVYKAPGMPKGIFRRHRGCKCVVLYDPADGGKIQGAHSKQEYTDYQEAIQRERNYLQKLDSMTPEERKYLRNSKLSKTAAIEKAQKSGTIVVHKSVGANAKNYPVKMPNSNQHVKLAENQIIEGKTFAGKGTKKEIRSRFSLESTYHIPADEWEKVAGKGYVIVKGKKRHAELHWYEVNGEIYELKIKRFLDED